jgi:hypothetical protein
MAYRAHIKNGVAVLDDDARLPEGCAVLIQPEGEPASLADVLRELIGQAKHLPPDGSIEHDHYIYGTPKQ